MARPEHPVGRTDIDNHHRGTDPDDGDAAAHHADDRSTNHFGPARYGCTGDHRRSGVDRRCPDNRSAADDLGRHDHRRAGHHGDDGGSHDDAVTDDDGCTYDHGCDDLVDDVDDPSSAHRW